MSRTQILNKLKAYKKNPEVFAPLTTNELADLVVVVLSQVNAIEEAMKSGQLSVTKPLTDAVNQAIREYQVRCSQLTDAVEASKRDSKRVIDQKADELSSEIESALKRLNERVQEVKDGIVTEEEVQRAAEMALSMIELPDFAPLISEQITANPQALRDGLELLSGEERYKVEIADVQGLTEALDQLARIRSQNGGTIGKQQVYGFIRQAIIDGVITSGGATTFTALTDTPANYTGQTGKYVKVNATEDALEFDTPPGTGIVETIVAGTGITVDSTDPANPVIAATPSAGGISEELAIAYAVSL